MDFITPQTIKDAGMTIVALSLVGMMYKLIANHFRHTNRTIDRNTAAMVKQAKINQKHTTLLEQLIRLLESKL